MRKDIILTMLSFNAVTAVGGGIMLMTGGIEPPSAWLQNTVFASYFMPGLILAGMVGGSALLAAIAYAVNRHYAAVMAMLSGLALCAWVINEVAVIQTYSWLQLVYLALGGLIIGLTYTESKQVLIYRHHRT